MAGIIEKKCKVSYSFDFEVDFNIRSKEIAESCLSFDLKCGGDIWKLVIHPDGLGEESSGYVSLFLNLCRSSDKSKRLVHYQVAIKDAHGIKCLSREKKQKFSENQEMGWTQFTSRVDFQSILKCGLTPGVLQISCNIDYIGDQPSLESPPTDNRLLQEQVSPNTLCTRLERAFRDQEHCDIIIKAQGRCFPAHKLILLLRTNISVENVGYNGVVEMPVFSSECVYDFLLYLYSDHLNTDNLENVHELHGLAGIYAVDDLEVKCAELLGY